jgi:hypothetical protein
LFTPPKFGKKKKKQTILLSRMRQKIGEYDTAGGNESGRLTEATKFSQKPSAEDKRARKEGAREREREQVSRSDFKA